MKVMEGKGKGGGREKGLQRSSSRPRLCYLFALRPSEQKRGEKKKRINLEAETTSPPSPLTSPFKLVLYREKGGRGRKRTCFYEEEEGQPRRRPHVFLNTRVPVLVAPAEGRGGKKKRGGNLIRRYKEGRAASWLTHLFFIFPP